MWRVGLKNSASFLKPMKALKIIKIAIDAAMFILFVLLMGQHLTVAAHEWMGLAVFMLFILHNALNYKWYTVLFKGRYTPMRIAQTAVNLLLIVVMIICLVSSVLVSVDVFAFLNLSGSLVGRTLHLVTTAWAFVLMSVHLGLHWSTFVAMAKRIKGSLLCKRIIKWILRITVLAVCAFGVYVFIERAFYEELFYLTAFKALDYDKTVFVYLLESVALSVLFSSIVYYTKKFILYARRKNREVKQNA